MLRSSHFEHVGRKLEVRASVVDNEVKIAVFENEVPATCVTYSVTIETQFDAKVRGFDPGLVNRLMSTAEEDVKRGLVPLKASK